MLGIGQLGLAGVHAEKAGIEAIDVIEHGTRFDEIRATSRRFVEGILELRLIEAADALDARAEVSPKRRSVGSAGKTPRETDDGDAVAGAGLPAAGGRGSLSSRLRSNE
jgi:hypothetical protein